MITTATDKLTVSMLGSILTSICGKINDGSPLSTSDRHTIPYLSMSITQDTTAPAAMTHIAIGNLGIMRLDAKSMTRATAPMIIDGTFAYFTVAAIFSVNSKSSPVPAPAPYSFGICINTIVAHIPDINPPITGVDM